MTPIKIKDIKKGDVFYERGSMDWYSLSALEDGHFLGSMEIMGKVCDQFTVNVKTEFGDVINILVTEGLEHYCAKYYKQADTKHTLPIEWVEENL
jgi:hypothetical protein